MDALVFAILDVVDRVQQFVGAGGAVLMLIAAVILFMWCLIAERMLYFRHGFPPQAQALRDLWEARAERQSWEAHQIRQALVADAERSAKAVIPTIKTLVALCPLLGLLGTVIGMIKVFAEIQLAGVGNAGNLAGGISEALITTAAGLSVAIPALICHRYFIRRVDELVVGMEQEAIKLVEVVHGDREIDVEGA